MIDGIEMLLQHRATLVVDLHRVNAAIAAMGPVDPTPRRGPSHITPAHRKALRAGAKRYWAQRRRERRA